MKTSKLVVTTTLGIAIALGALIESAEAQTVRRRTSNTYSPTSFDDQNVISQFTLVDTKVDGTSIVDQNGNLNVGLFNGAIENFVEASGVICQSSTDSGCQNSFDNSDVNDFNNYVYNDSGFVLFREDFPLTPTTSPFNGNLLVELFNPGEDPLFRSSQDVTIGYTVLQPERNKPAYTYRLEQAVYNTIPGFNRDRAINSLSYIFDQNLLGRTSPVIFNPLDFNENSTYRYPSDLINFTSDITGGNVPVQNQQVSKPVPEPGNMLGILIASALGIGSRIKRTKQNRDA